MLALTLSRTAYWYARGQVSVHLYAHHGHDDDGSMCRFDGTRMVGSDELLFVILVCSIHMSAKSSSLHDVS